MATNPIPSPLPADLPTNWVRGQTIAPAGSDVGLAKQYGYNYLMAAVNAAQSGVNTIGNAFSDLATTSEIADFYTKLQTVSDSTKTEYGLQSTAIPDNLFAILANAILWINSSAVTVKNTQLPICKIYTGSYNGTGTSGRSNPTTITSPFVPQVVFVSTNRFDESASSSASTVVMLRNINTYYSLYGGRGVDPSVSGSISSWTNTSVSWYNTINQGQLGPRLQMNLTGSTYQYVVLG